jgi:hypothetical protein
MHWFVIIVGHIATEDAESVGTVCLQVLPPSVAILRVYMAIKHFSETERAAGIPGRGSRRPVSRPGHGPPGSCGVKSWMTGSSPGRAWVWVGGVTAIFWSASPYLRDACYNISQK